MHPWMCSVMLTHAVSSICIMLGALALYLCKLRQQPPTRSMGWAFHEQPVVPHPVLAMLVCMACPCAAHIEELQDSILSVLIACKALPKQHAPNLEHTHIYTRCDSARTSRAPWLGWVPCIFWPGQNSCVLHRPIMTFQHNTAQD